MNSPLNSKSTGSDLRIPLTVWSRHLRIAFKYGNLKKFTNLGKAYLYYLKGSLKITTMPAFLKVEISRCCYVRCKYCFEEKAEIFYPFPLYKTLIDKLKYYLFEVSLYDIGEPLLNKNILDYIRYAHFNKIGTIISTSLSVKKPDEFWKNIILSGLDYLIVSIDGISEKVYNQYRTYGDLNLVLSNLMKLQEYRSKYKNNIFIEWQMIDLPWNKHEQKSAKSLSRELGCDSFRLIPEVTQKRIRYSKEILHRQRNCLLPFIIFIVNAYNQVRPCYKIYGGNLSIGDLNHSTFEEIWNGEEISQIRNKYSIRSREYCSTCRE
jgi:radical SAM protein with 4Fe4S-binding SPASM domain